MDSHTNRFGITFFAPGVVPPEPGVRDPGPEQEYPDRQDSSGSDQFSDIPLRSASASPDPGPRPGSAGAGSAGKKGGRKRLLSSALRLDGEAVLKERVLKSMAAKEAAIELRKQRERNGALASLYCCRFSCI